MTKELEHIIRIVPGRGCDCVLLIGSERTALVDAGMSYCSGRLAVRLEQELYGRSLDFVLLTHSHYDHAGGVAGLRGRWPALTVFGSRHARDIFRREGAQRTIRSLSDAAAKLYLGQDQRLWKAGDFTDYDEKAIQVDRVIGEGDTVSLGDMSIRVLDTPGHTNCSLSFYIPEKRLMFPSESIGCYGEGGRMESPFLTSFQATLNSIEACRRCGAELVISPHYGLVTDISPQAYFDLAEKTAFEVRDYLLELYRRGLTREQMLKESIKHFWVSRGESRDEQPLPAFTINMKATIEVVLRECAAAK